MFWIIVLRLSSNEYIFAIADSNADSIDEIKARPLSITLPIWIPGFRGQIAIGDVDLSAETDGDTIIDRRFNSDGDCHFNASDSRISLFV